MCKHRKIWDFEYDYDEIITKWMNEDWEFVIEKSFKITIKSAPWIELGTYMRNNELLEFIHELEQSWELDKVKTEYIWSDSYGPKITEPRPWTEPYTWTYDDNSNVILCNNNEHDAETRTHVWKTSFSRIRSSAKDLSKQTYLNKETLS